MRKKCGLALSGGGIKAFSQVGVVRFLKENGFKFDGFSGTSMGSIIATLLAHDIPINQVENSILKIEKIIIDEKLLDASNAQVFPLITRSITGLIDPSRFVRIIEEEFEQYNIKYIKDVKFPLVITSVDLISGKIVYFTNRKELIKSPYKYFIIMDDVLLIDAIRASCSFPMVFATMNFRNMQLVDGGVLMNVPVAPLKSMGLEKVLSISMDSFNVYQGSSKVTEIGGRIIDLMANQSTNAMLSLSDYNINVFDKKIGIFSFGQGKNAINLGYQVSQIEKKSILEFKKTLNKFFF
jgi:NTE family protein